MELKKIGNNGSIMLFDCSISDNIYIVYDNGKREIEVCKANSVDRIVGPLDNIAHFVVISGLEEDDFRKRLEYTIKESNYKSPKDIKALHDKAKYMITGVKVVDTFAKYIANDLKRIMQDPSYNYTRSRYGQ